MVAKKPGPAQVVGRILLIGGCMVWGSISMLGFMRWKTEVSSDGPHSSKRAAEWRKVALTCAALTVINFSFGIIYHWRTWW